MTFILFVLLLLVAIKEGDSLETAIGKLVQVVVVEFQRVQSEPLKSFIIHRLQIRPGDLDVSNVGLGKVCKEEKRSCCITFHRRSSDK